MIDFLTRLFHTLFPLTQQKMNDFIGYVGPHPFCAVMFLIIFCETGLVVTPFLPGDSLLFTLGAIGSSPNPSFHLPTISLLLLAAALLGDNTNYWLGRRLGPAVFRREDSRLLNKKHLTRAHTFYETYGPKTIILARFVPIIRTFAPFVAGVGQMSYPTFLLFSVVGGFAWVAICITAGALFGTQPFVQKHFELVVLAIILISILPMALELLRARSHRTPPSPH
ncbi:MAG TPA: VTT domain-containing protein [Tepidisphaeraceae bacterium]|jgi:membrane-associated protein|nr:VTT domain-containing protein [Tepidisphaeraceae bacterium]